LVGDGPNAFGLTAGGGNGNRRGTIGGKGGGSKYGWYAGRVQNAIATALRNNPTTRTAAFTLNVKIWADRSGRVTRAQLVGSTGRSDIDQIIRNQILNGLMLSDPPPEDMPMPINLRITARKP
jgi:outer membrane biosynthesis protein TonB